jgi:hypothetical protein
MATTWTHVPLKLFGRLNTKQAVHHVLSSRNSNVRVCASTVLTIVAQRSENHIHNEHKDCHERVVRYPVLLLDLN